MSAEYGFNRTLHLRLDVRTLTIGDQFSLLQDLTRQLLVENPAAKDVRPAIRQYLATCLDQSL